MYVRDRERGNRREEGPYWRIMEISITDMAIQSLIVFDSILIPLVSPCFFGSFDCLTHEQIQLLTCCSKFNENNDHNHDIGCEIYTMPEL